MQGVTPTKRKTIYLAAAETLAAIHKVDVTAIGLQKYGRRDNYCKRQVGDTMFHGIYLIFDYAYLNLSDSDCFVKTKQNSIHFCCH
jgi:hypothetical protein